MNAVTLAAIWEVFEACLGVAVLAILLADWINDHLVRKGKP